MFTAIPNSSRELLKNRKVTSAVEAKWARLCLIFECLVVSLITVFDTEEALAST